MSDIFLKHGTLWFDPRVLRKFTLADQTMDPHAGLRDVLRNAALAIQAAINALDDKEGEHDSAERLRIVESALARYGITRYMGSIWRFVWRGRSRGGSLDEVLAEFHDTVFNDGQRGRVEGDEAVRALRALGIEPYAATMTAGVTWRMMLSTGRTTYSGSIETLLRIRSEHEALLISAEHIESLERRRASFNERHLQHETVTGQAVSGSGAGHVDAELRNAAELATPAKGLAR